MNELAKIRLYRVNGNNHAIFFEENGFTGYDDISDEVYKRAKERAKRLLVATNKVGTYNCTQAEQSEFRTWLNEIISFPF